MEALICQVQDDEAHVREHARVQLIDIGIRAVPAVSVLAKSSRVHVRWECAKILAAIADPDSVPVLVRLLEDSDAGVRWDAAEGLIAIGQPSVTPVLRAIIHRSLAFTIIAAAHHVMHELAKQKWGEFLKPVYEALERQEPAISGPTAAAEALNDWEYKSLAG